MAMENREIAKIFHDIADLLDIKGGNPFRSRSYRNAARVIEGLAISLESIVETDEKKLEDIPGIGKGMHEKIVELVKTGRCVVREELLKELPPGLLDILNVSGIGHKKAELLYKELGIKDVEGLEDAARAGRLRGLSGMGEKSEAKLIKAIESYKRLKSGGMRHKISSALRYAEDYLRYMKEAPEVIRLEAAGSLRRWKETIGDIDILATCEKSGPAIERFVSYPDVASVIAKGGTKASVMLRNGLQADLRVVEEKSFGAALQYFTGNKAHNVALRERAGSRGLKLSEYGLFDKKGRYVAGKTEEDVYKALGLEWIPPELRENSGEIEAAEKGRLPKLVELKDIKGDLHVHTIDSDGNASMTDIAGAAMKTGYAYVAVTDHSKAVGIARGMDDERLLEQCERVDRLNEKLEKQGSSFRVLKGAEVDIKSDGALDYRDETLRKLDIAVGAVHSKFDMTRDDMTDRLLKAISSRMIHVLAHPTGRLIGTREPYDFDMQKVMRAASRHKVAIELNAFPDRLDLNDSHCRLAKDMGVMVAISTDSHSVMNLDYMRYGVRTARRGWLEKKDVLNCMTLKKLMVFLKR